MNRHRCECSICTERGVEIDRLQEAKRAALKLADERAIEANGLRQALNRIQTVLLPIDDADHIETVGRAREIALFALNEKAT